VDLARQSQCGFFADQVFRPLAEAIQQLPQIQQLKLLERPRQHFTGDGNGGLQVLGSV